MLLDALSVMQNLAMPFTLDIDPPAPTTCGSARCSGPGGRADRSRDWLRRCQNSMPPARVRVRVGRALALDPKVLLLEHADAGLAPAQPLLSVPISGILRRGADAARRRHRRPAVCAPRSPATVLTLDPATGRLSDSEAMVLLHRPASRMTPGESTMRVKIHFVLLLSIASVSACRC